MKQTDVMRAIRKMESAWTEVCKCKFALTSRTIIQPNGGTREVPCYLLTKAECLYIATKFNDEARAKLVIRWQELEEERLMEIQKPKQKIQEIRLLACDEEVLDEADDILGEELEKLNRESRFCYTPTEIGKVFGQWQLTQKYLHRELTANRYSYVHGRDGRRKLVSRLVWTEKGREFIMDMIKR